MSRHHNSRQNRNVSRANKSPGNVKFPCLGAAETNRSSTYIQNGPEGRLNSGNTCFYLIQKYNIFLFMLFSVHVKYLP
jgi:hypothetical protein